MDPTIDYQKLATALLKQVVPAGKAVSATPTTIYGHGGIYGQAGAFSFPGLEPDVLNAMVMPKLGLLDLLPSRTADTDTPLYGIITGVTASSGSEPTGPCADPKSAGVMKMCTHSFVWGRFSRQTRVFELDRMGRRRDRSDFLDLNLIGEPMSGNWPPAAPGDASPRNALRSEIAKALFEFGVAWGRDFATKIFDGNPTSNVDEGYKEPYGLDILINTGYRDAETGVACPAADSIVRDFEAFLDGNEETFIRQITNVIRNLEYRARGAGLWPVDFAIAMPWAMFWEITEFWPCSYMAYRCKTTDTSKIDPTPFINAADGIAMRDEMRAGQYLLIDGKKYPVVLDDGIAETELAGSCQNADLYIVPLRVLGGRPVTFLEYFNYDGPYAAMDAAKIFAPAGSYWTTNGGRYLWHAKPPTNFCVQLLAKTEWRVVLETPYLAARITDIKYCPVGHQVSPFPDNTSYHVDGGGYTRDAKDASYFTPTAAQ